MVKVEDCIFLGRPVLAVFEGKLGRMPKHTLILTLSIVLGEEVILVGPNKKSVWFLLHPKNI